MEVEQLQSSPNYGTVTLTCPGKAPVTYPTVTMEQGERWWTPGSGYASALTPGVWAGNVGGCLGRVDIYRTTTVYISAF